MSIPLHVHLVSHLSGLTIEKHMPCAVLLTSKRSAQAEGWKPEGPGLGNGEAWFTTAVLAEGRPAMALPKRFQKVRKSLMFSSAMHRDRFCSKPIPRAKRPSPSIRTDALFAVIKRSGRLQPSIWPGSSCTQSRFFPPRFA